MKLNLQTDYAIRTLILLAAHKNRRFSIAQIADAYKISRNHLMKIVPKLEKRRWIESVPGPGGGISLVAGAEELSLSEIVEAFEPLDQLVECFDPENNTCPITPVCGLKRVLVKAQRQFVESLAHTTVSDIARPRTELTKLLGLHSP